MKKFVTLFLAFFICLTVKSQSNYSKGYESGYKAGYCHLKVNCIAPIPPIAPIPQVSEDMNSYSDGYNRGFALGLEAQKSINNKPTQSQGYKTATPENIDYMYKINYNDIEGLSKALYNVKGKTIEYLKNGNYSAAIKTAKNGLSVSPYDDEFMILLGEGYRKLGDSKNAIRYYKRAYKRNGEGYLLDFINGLKEGRTDLPVLNIY